MNTIDKLKQLEATATPGPWKVGNYSGRHHGLLLLSEDAFAGNLVSGRDNVKLIVAMRNALPKLLDSISRLEAVVEAAQALVNCPYVVITEKADDLQGDFEDALAALED